MSDVFVLDQGESMACPLATVGLQLASASARIANG